MCGTRKLSGDKLPFIPLLVISRGYIRVNGRLETSAPDVWAIGECAGSPQFTHISEDDFRIIRDNLAGGIAALAIGWLHTACSQILRWPT